MDYQNIIFDCAPAVREKGVKVVVLTLENLQNRDVSPEFEIYKAGVCRKILAERSEASIREDSILQGFRELHRQFGFSNRSFPAHRKVYWNIYSNTGGCPKSIYWWIFTTWFRSKLAWPWVLMTWQPFLGMCTCA